MSREYQSGDQYVNETDTRQYQAGSEYLNETVDSGGDGVPTVHNLLADPPAGTIWKLKP